MAMPDLRDATDQSRYAKPSQDDLNEQIRKAARAVATAVPKEEVLSLLDMLGLAQDLRTLRSPQGRPLALTDTVPTQRGRAVPGRMQSRSHSPGLGSN